MYRYMYDDFLPPTEEDILNMKKAFESEHSGQKQAHALIVLYRFLAARVLSKRQRQFFLQTASELAESFCLPDGYGMRQAALEFPGQKMPTSLRMGIRFAVWLEARFAQKLTAANTALMIQRLDIICCLSS